MRERNLGNGEIITTLRLVVEQANKDKASFESMLGDFSLEGRAQIMRAYDVASICHTGQKRNDGTNFITHLIGTAAIAIFFGERDVDQICKDFLHDSIEDTDHWVKMKRRYADRISIGVERIAQEFGLEVAESVAFVTKFTTKDVKGKTHGARKANATKKTHEKFDKGTPEQQVSKMPDRLHNILTIAYIGKGRAKKKLKETEEFYIPRWRKASRDLPVYQRMLVATEIAVKDAKRALVRPS